MYYSPYVNKFLFLQYCNKIVHKWRLCFVWCIKRGNAHDFIHTQIVWYFAQRFISNDRRQLNYCICFKKSFCKKVELPYELQVLFLNIFINYSFTLIFRTHFIWYLAKKLTVHKSTLPLIHNMILFSLCFELFLRSRHNFFRLS